MVYPHQNKFIQYNDIAESLTGFVRMIEFRCFALMGYDNEYYTGYDLPQNSMVDPTLHNSHL